MSPRGIQRTIAVIIFFSPWIFIPGLIKDVIFIAAGVFLFVSTLDLRKRQYIADKHEEQSASPAPLA